jgi:AcrR family transcriptional regulator
LSTLPHRTKAVTRRTAPRRRRSAADMREAILKAAEQRLLNGGPEAIRLQEIAADVGISHPLILHHFGSREGLVEALVIHGFERLQGQFLEGWPSLKQPDIAGVMERFYDVASRLGVARLLAWLTLSGKPIEADLLLPAAERMHAGRVRRAAAAGRRPPDKDETLFAASFLAILALGDALFGPAVRKAMGLGSSAASTQRFRQRLVKLLEAMEERGPSASKPPTAV